MLQITIPAIEEGWDEDKEEFVYSKEQTLQLEHSLVSLSKWEAKWNKAFLAKHQKSDEEIIDYIKCMTITQNVNPNVYSHLSNTNIEQINAYIEAPMSATHIQNNGNNQSSREPITSELIYYWMITLNIPFECQKWHLNRLLTLIEVCSIKNRPTRKMSRSELMRSNSAINQARRKQLNSRG